MLGATVTFTRIKNLFERVEESWRMAWCPGKSIADYLPIHDFASFIVECNGRRVSKEHRPTKGDHVVIVDVPRTPTIVFYVLATIVIGVGSYLINRATMPKPVDSDFGTDDGPTSAFGGIQSISASGVPIPLIYGQVRVGGNIVDTFESALSDENLVPEDPPITTPVSGGFELLSEIFKVPKINRLSRSMSVLNTRVALALGPVEAIEDIEIDNTTRENYPGLVTHIRTGHQRQPSIPGFDRTVNTRTLALPVLKASPVTITTQTEVQTIEVILRFPQGLYKVKDDGFRFLHDVILQVEYRLQSATAWTDAGTFTVSDFSVNALEYRVRLPNLDRNFYQVRVTRITDDETNPKKFSSFQVFFINEIDFQDRTHPGIAFMAFEQLPGEQVSPITPTTYTAVVKGFNNIRTYTDESTFTTGWTDNPAWCAAHFLTNKLGGLGRYFDWDDIDIPSFIAWAAHCDELVEDGRQHLEKRATYNNVFDTRTSAFEALQTFAIGTGVLLVYKGSKFRAIIDEEKPLTHIFNESNIDAGSLGVGWFPRAELPKRVSGSFRNAEQKWERDSIMQEDPDSIPGEFQTERSMQLLHITRPSQVARELMRVINGNKFVTRGVEFSTGLKGLGLELGDRFGISSKSVNMGLGSGVITAIAADNKTLTLDDDVTIEAAKSYEIHIEHKYDGVIDVKGIVTAGTVTTNIVEVDDAHWSRILQVGDKYSIGEVSTTIEEYRVDELRVGDLGPNFSIQVRGGLYDERVFDLTPVSNPIVSVKEIPFRDSVPGKVTAINLEFVPAMQTSLVGRIETRTIHVDWEPPESFSIDHYEVLMREVGKTWIPMGQTKGRRFEISRNVDVDTTYEITVLAISPGGLRISIDDAPKTTVETY